MPVQTSEGIRQYLILQQKDQSELAAICEGLGLDTTGLKDELLNRLTQEPSKPQNDIILPQTIPLRTTYSDGEIIPEALHTYLCWRHQIFINKNNTKKFNMITQYNKIYELEMRYIDCSIEMTNKIIQEKWYDPQYTQGTDLINLLKTKPHYFKTSIVQKSGKNGRSFIMLHVEPKIINKDNDTDAKI